MFSLGFPLLLFFMIAAPNRNEHNFDGSGIPIPLYCGLIKVKGHFDRLEGWLETDRSGQGRLELIIDAASLNTGNRKRDQHPRSAAHHHLQSTVGQGRGEPAAVIEREERVVRGPGDQRRLCAGPEDRALLIMNHGTPGSGMVYRGWVERCANHGIRLASYSRPGYRGSTRLEGRSIAHCAADVAAVADALGAERFYVEGHSGGGAPALACAALLPDRVQAAAIIAGAAPKDADGFDWWAGNAEENLEEFRAAELGGEALRRLLEDWRDEMLEPSANDIGESLATLGSLVSATDRAVVTPELSAFNAARRRHSISGSIWGWFDDDLSEMKPWGFEIDSIKVPVSIWYGEDDKFVPRSHADWLMANVPAATRRMLPRLRRNRLPACNPPRGEVVCEKPSATARARRGRRAVRAEREPCGC